MILAKETMQAVSEAEKAANDTMLHTREECERLLAEAKAQGRKIIADAKKAAAAKAEELCTAAQAAAVAQKGEFAGETTAKQDGMRKAAEAAMPRAAEEIKKIVLGKCEGRQ